MKNTAISTYELMRMFPDQETARVYIEKRRWPNGPVCPTCKDGKSVSERKNGYYRCNSCHEDFTVRSGTIFGRSHIELNKWLYAMYLLVTARKGISSMQLSKEIGVTQKTAWFMLGRIREACGDDFGKLSGIIEIDETWVGGKEKNKHASHKVGGRGTYGKVPVMGMRERGGRTKAMPVTMPTREEVFGMVTKNVELGITLNTDEHSGFDDLHGVLFNHETVNHKNKEYVRDGVTTNSIESVWAVFKRGMYGVYHGRVETKHLSRYVNEFTFRLNEGNVERQSMERLTSLIEKAVGKRLTYKALTGKTGTEG